MGVRIFPWALFLAMLQSCSDGPTAPPGPIVPPPPTQPPAGRVELDIKPDSAWLIVGDTLQLAVVVTTAGGDTVTSAISWMSLDSTIASVTNTGRVVGRNLGNARIVASGSSASDTVSLRVGQIRGCVHAGVTHRGTIATEMWKAIDSPHFIADTVTVAGTLTIEAGAIVCAQPRALINPRGGKLQAIGRSDRRIRLMAIDTILGWAGIVAGGLSNDPGGSIVLDYVDVEYASFVAAGYQSTAVIENSTFRRTFVGSGGANFATVTIRRSIIEDGNVQMSSGVFEETIIRRGTLGFVPAQPGSGNVTINGGRIEDSPGVALTIGSTFSFRVPNVTVLKAPEIVRSRGGIAVMPPERFFALWPTPVEQAALLDNVDRKISLWGQNFGDLRLRAGLDWVLWSPIGIPEIKSLALDAGATLRLDTYARVAGPMNAIGTSSQPITISSASNCFSRPHCNLTLNGTTTSRISHVMLTNTDLLVAEQNVTHMDNVTTNGYVSLAAPGSSIRVSRIADVRTEYFVITAALGLHGTNVIAERVSVQRVATPGNAPAVAITGSGVRLSGCEITDNQGDGIVVSGGTDVHIFDCNIENNAGFGVNNRTSETVDARGNWWGDPAGPFGLYGDGVSGAVDWIPARTAPLP